MTSKYNLKPTEKKDRLWQNFTEAEKIQHGSIICEVIWFEGEPTEIKVLDKKPRYRG